MPRSKKRDNTTAQSDNFNPEVQKASDKILTSQQTKYESLPKEIEVKKEMLGDSERELKKTKKKLKDAKVKELETLQDQVNKLKAEEVNVAWRSKLNLLEPLDPSIIKNIDNLVDVNSRLAQPDSYGIVRVFYDYKKPLRKQQSELLLNVQQALLNRIKRQLEKIDKIVVKDESIKAIKKGIDDTNKDITEMTQIQQVLGKEEELKQFISIREREYNDKVDNLKRNGINAGKFDFIPALKENALYWTQKNTLESNIRNIQQIELLQKYADLNITERRENIQKVFANNQAIKNLTGVDLSNMETLNKLLGLDKIQIDMNANLVQNDTTEQIKQTLAYFENLMAGDNLKIINDISAKLQELQKIASENKNIQPLVEAWQKILQEILSIKSDCSIAEINNVLPNLQVALGLALELRDLYTKVAGLPKDTQSELREKAQKNLENIVDQLKNANFKSNARDNNLLISDLNKVAISIRGIKSVEDSHNVKNLAIQLNELERLLANSLINQEDGFLVSLKHGAKNLLKEKQEKILKASSGASNNVKEEEWKKDYNDVELMIQNVRAFIENEEIRKVKIESLRAGISNLPTGEKEKGVDLRSLVQGYMDKVDELLRSTNISENLGVIKNYLALIEAIEQSKNVQNFAINLNTLRQTAATVSLADPALKPLKDSTQSLIEDKLKRLTSSDPQVIKSIGVHEADNCYKADTNLRSIRELKVNQGFIQVRSDISKTQNIPFLFKRTHDLQGRAIQISSELTILSDNFYTQAKETTKNLNVARALENEEVISFVLELNKLQEAQKNLPEEMRPIAISFNIKILEERLSKILASDQPEDIESLRESTQEVIHATERLKAITLAYNRYADLNRKLKQQPSPSNYAEMKMEGVINLLRGLQDNSFNDHIELINGDLLEVENIVILAPMVTKLKDDQEKLKKPGSKIDFKYLDPLKQSIKLLEHQIEDELNKLTFIGARIDILASTSKEFEIKVISQLNKLEGLIKIKAKIDEIDTLQNNITKISAEEGLQKSANDSLSHVKTLLSELKLDVNESEDEFAKKITIIEKEFQTVNNLNTPIVQSLVQKITELQNLINTLGKSGVKDQLETLVKESRSLLNEIKVGNQGLKNVNDQMIDLEKGLKLGDEQKLKEEAIRKKQINEFHEKLVALSINLHGDQYNTHGILIRAWSKRNYPFAKVSEEEMEQLIDKVGQAEERLKEQLKLAEKEVEIKKDLDAIEKDTKEIVNELGELAKKGQLGMRIEKNKRKLKNVLDRHQEIYSKRISELKAFSENFLSKPVSSSNIDDFIGNAITIGLLRPEDVDLLPSFWGDNYQKTLFSADGTRVSDKAIDELKGRLIIDLNLELQSISTILSLKEDLTKTLDAISEQDPLIELRNKYTLLLKQIRNYQNTWGYFFKTMFTLGQLSSRKILNKLTEELVEKKHKVTKIIDDISKKEQDWLINVKPEDRRKLLFKHDAKKIQKEERGTGETKEEAGKLTSEKGRSDEIENEIKRLIR